MPRHIEPDRPQSSALLANLEETRREVVVPDEYLALVETVGRYYGVRQALEKLLNEFFHPLRNVKVVTSQLRSLCGGMFHYFERTDDRTSSASLLNALFGALYTTEFEAEQLSSLVGTHLQFLDTMGRSGYHEEYSPVVLQALEQLTYLALERHHPGWEINDGACGELVIDVAEATVVLDCSLRFTSTDDHSTEL